MPSLILQSRRVTRLLLYCHATGLYSSMYFRSRQTLYE